MTFPVRIYQQFLLQEAKVQEQLYNNNPSDMIATQQQQYSAHLPASPNKTDPDTEAEEQDIQGLNKHSLKQKRNNISRSNKIKSSLCKNFMLHGFCPYGERCQFAHGPQQLRCNTFQNTSYKTKPCFSYLNKGYCPYGHRCNFIHRRQVPSGGWFLSSSLQNFPEMVQDFGQIRGESRLLSKLVSQRIDIYFPRQ